MASKCFACHGPDEDHQEAGLRFDDLSVAIELEAIVSGDPDNSSLIDRIYSDDADSIMPPPSSGEVLTPQQKRVFKRWISEGAKYEKHWAFEPPKKAEPPQVKNSKWPTNPIDQFVLGALEAKELNPSQKADRYTLVRRVYLDLIGMVPTVEEAKAFVNSNDPHAYEKLVDRLLASKHYGERWAQPWLDLARYSDTNGYEKDRERSAWPYRDWVIRSLNADLPYDQFSIEQLAGDMLASPTPDQLIATGFHRNTMLNEEGGIDPLEYRYLAMVDRVATTGTVWMGLTVGCAQCHTHKYDPISHSDYFQMMALMNNADEPDFLIPDPERINAIRQAESRISQMELDLEAQFPIGEGDGKEEVLRQKHFRESYAAWIKEQKQKAVDWEVIRPVSMSSNSPLLELQEDGSVFASGDTTKRDVYKLSFDVDGTSKPIHALRLEALPDERLPDFGPGKTYYEGRKGDFFVSEIDGSFNGESIKFSGATHTFSGSKETEAQRQWVFDGDGSTGWKPGANKSRRLVLVINLEKPITTRGSLAIEMLFERHYTVSLGRFRFSTTGDANAKANRFEENIESTLATRVRNEWTEEEELAVRRAFLVSTPLLAEPRKPIEAARKRIPRLDHCLVLAERPDNNLRPTHRHHRGEFLSPKELVKPSIPSMFRSQRPNEVGPANRLEFAQWLVSAENPLVARTVVNRAWRELFGFGLMRTSGDFGVQSQPPTHLELLDWLAVHFREDLNWSTKSLHRLIVTSSTYKQSSVLEKSALHGDRENVWLARGPNFRMSGEMFRDVCLKASGTLSDKMYGRGVRPPQPASVTQLAYGSGAWPVSMGDDRYRRSIYTFRKRTAAFAAYTVFDGPTGESCTAKRNRSNTPLQALTVLNDQMYQEFAVALAKKASLNFPDNAGDAISHAFQSFLTRPPTQDELIVLKMFYDQQIERLSKGELKSKDIAGSGASDREAALTMIGRAIMNLDESITKR